MKYLVCAVFLVLAVEALKKDRRNEFQSAMDSFREEDGLLMSEPLSVTKKRYEQYCKDADTVDEINADDSVPYTAKTNPLSILTPEERAQHMGFNVSGVHDSGHDIEGSFELLEKRGAAPAARDFRKKACNPVKNQGSCGSCWAFGAASALESEMYFVSGRLSNLAEQEYLVCSSVYGGNRHNGCNGGWMEWCYKYNMDKNRMGYAKSNPYTGKDDFTCSNNNKGPNAFEDARVKVTANVKVSGDARLLAAAASHVISVAVHVNNKFQVYSKGVYVDARCNAGANHAVTVVGYGQEGDNKFWLVRNSWGAHWGDKGYIKMDRGKENMCHVSQYSHYPKVECVDASCKGVSPDAADGSGEEEEEEEEEEKEDSAKICKFGKKVKAKLIKGSMPSDGCSSSLTAAQKVCKVTEKCVGVNKRKTCYWAVAADKLETVKAQKKFWHMAYECETACPTGTMRCADGVCRHEHMC